MSRQQSVGDYEAVGESSQFATGSAPNLPCGTETSELVRQGLFWKESDPISSGSGREAVQRAFSLPASPSQGLRAGGK